MKVEYEAICAETEELLRAYCVSLPLAWMVGFLLDYAETGLIDPYELQDMVKQIHSVLGNQVVRE